MVYGKWQRLVLMGRERSRTYEASGADGVRGSGEGIETTAFAPSNRAFSIMRSRACLRLSSSSSVYWVTSPY